MSENYSDILNTQWDDIPEPKVLPDGSYLLKLRNASYQPAKGEGDPTVMFAYKVVEPMDDVPQDENDKLGNDYDYDLNTIFSRFWISNTADWAKVRKHLEKHGVDVSGKTPTEALKDARGSEVVAFLQQRSYTNNSGQDVTENQPTNFSEVQ